MSSIVPTRLTNRGHLISASIIYFRFWIRKSRTLGFFILSFFSQFHGIDRIFQEKHSNWQLCLPVSLYSCHMIFTRLKQRKKKTKIRLWGFVGKATVFIFFSSFRMFCESNWLILLLLLQVKNFKKKREIEKHSFYLSILFIVPQIQKLEF